MEWPNLIQAPGFNVNHTLWETRVIIHIDTSRVIYEGSNHSSKYSMINVPPLFPCISFEIMIITLEDPGFYSVGTTDDDFSLDRGVFLIVIGIFFYCSHFNALSECFNIMNSFFKGQYDDLADRAVLHPVNQEAMISVLDFQDFSKCF